MGNPKINKQAFIPLQSSPMGPLAKPQDLKEKSLAPSAPMPFETPNDQLVQSSAVGSASASIVFQDEPEMPTEQEMNWATQMQGRVLQGYKPTSEEAALYEDIQARFQAAMEVETTEVRAEPPTDVELEWAQQLERHIEVGYPPTSKEIEAYKDIMTRLEISSTQQQEPRPLSWPVSQEELNWASDLQQKVEQGYQSTEQELKIYNNIYERYQNEQQEYPVQVQETSNVSKEELHWAMDLEEKVKQGYELTPAETKAYEAIVQRLMVEQ